MNGGARCRAIFLSEPCCIPCLYVFPCICKGGKRINPRPLLQTKILSSLRKCQRNSNLWILMVKDHQLLAQPRLTGSSALYAKNTQQKQWDALCSTNEQTRGVDTLHLQSIYPSLMNLASSLQHCQLEDWMRVMVLKQPCLRTKLNIIKHAGLCIMKPSWKEQTK